MKKAFFAAALTVFLTGNLTAFGQGIATVSKESAPEAAGWTGTKPVGNDQTPGVTISTPATDASQRVQVVNAVDALSAGSTPRFVTPEPSVVILTALGGAAAIFFSRKKRA